MRLVEIGVAESISDDKFATRSRIEVPNARAQTLSSQKSPKMVSRAGNDRVFIGQVAHLWQRPRELGDFKGVGEIEAKF